MSKFKLLGLLLVLLMTISAANVFAQDPTEEAPEGDVLGESLVTLPAVDPLLIEGDIVSAGSSTVFPLSAAMVERFVEAGYLGTITIDSVGTGAGFERFCVNAETDISNASRAINEDEIAACEENGRTPIEFRVGTDALAVVVSAENDFVDTLTVEQLGAIYSGDAATWADVNPEWPADAIELYSPGSDSGTFDYFSEAVFADRAEAEGLEDTSYILNAPNRQLSEDDNVLVQGVAASPNAIGYFGYAYYQENAEVLRAIPVEGVEPTFESVEGVEGFDPYPLARPLYIYSDATIMAEKPQVAEFISYYLTNVNEIIVEVGYFPAGAETLDAAKTAWCEATGAACEIAE
jgi:phosphate transport system substrate-binding protein